MILPLPLDKPVFASGGRSGHAGRCGVRSHFHWEFAGLALTFIGSWLGSGLTFTPGVGWGQVSLSLRTFSDGVAGAGNQYDGYVPAYLDHAASSPLRPEALDAMLPWFDECHANPTASHRKGRRARQALDEARAVIAQATGFDRGDVVFTGGGTESDNLAIGRGHQPGRIVVSAICLLYTSPSPRDQRGSRMPSSA